MVNLKLRWVLSLLPFCAAAALLAAPPAPSDVEGPLGLVRVSGGGYREARDAARHLEDVFHRLETLGGRPFDTSFKPFVKLVLPASPWGPPSLDVSPSSNGLPWRIVVSGPLEDTIPDLNAYAARLALSLWSGQGGRPLDRGDWLAVGLAGNLLPLSKARNRELTQQLVDEGRLPSLETIVTWNRMPDGPMMEKAAVCQAVAWMLTGPNNGDLPALLEQIRQDRVTGDWILALEATRGGDPEVAWRAAAMKGDILAGGVRPFSPMLFRQFRQALLTPPTELGLDGSAGVPPLSPYQLLAVRGSTGAREAARLRSAAVQKMAVGTPPELMAVALRYKAFFDGLAGRSLSFMLRRRLRQAEQALRGVEDQAAARAEWVDLFDEAAADGVTVAPFERTAIERAVDQAEARMEAAPAAKGKE
jgi:hypothetical protein